MNTRVLLHRVPEGLPAADDFQLETTAAAQPADGELACETLYLSLDPYMRGKISGRHLTGRIHPGELMAGEAISRVVSSRSGQFAAGDLVCAHSGWQSHPVIPAAAATAVDPRLAPPSLALGIAGMPGLTAYAGVMRLFSAPRPGSTLVVSSAAGPVGSMVGQMARLRGCRVVGIAGSEAKCAWLTDAAGFDACINYRQEALRDGLDRCCPDGIDRYFDNVGGDVLQAAMERLAIGAEVVLCGLMAQYNSAEAPPGPNPALIIKARATVRGLVVYDHEDLRAQMLDSVTAWLAEGRIAWREDRVEGLEAAPEAFARLMRGDSFGKVIVRVGTD